MSRNKINLTIDVGMNIKDVVAGTTSIQNNLEKIKAPKVLQDRLKRTFIAANKAAEEFGEQAKKSINSAADIKKLDTSYRALERLMEQLDSQLQELKMDPKKLIPDDVATRLRRARQELRDFQKAIDTPPKDTTAGVAFKEYEKQKKAVAELQVAEMNRLRFVAALEKQLADQRQVAADAKAHYEDREKFPSRREGGAPAARKVAEEAAAAVAELEELVKKSHETFKSSPEILEAAEAKLEKLKNTLDEAREVFKESGLEDLRKHLAAILEVDPSKITGDMAELQAIIDGIESGAIKNAAAALEEMRQNMVKSGSGVKGLGEEVDSVADKFKELADTEKEIENLQKRMISFFGIGNAIRLFKGFLNDAMRTIGELDKAMTETAVVTPFSVGDMWKELPRYTKAANELGTTTLGAYETMTLFYQQGLKTNEVFEVGRETMKMARIAGLEYAETTDLMTAALRGFNMEINETSAQRINDVYSQLAAITAANTYEIAHAMTKTAAIANSANMEFENTAALLSQMIETTREAPENLGTAMKTIIARFTKLQKDPLSLEEVDGEVVDANAVETALRSIGVALRDAKGEFRDLDDVFLEMAEKWDSLTTNQQRYVASMAAGSRQQSRFIAMMSDYDRTLELTGAAHDSAGTSQKQFEKTLESLESKMAILKNAWDEFTMGIMNSQILKWGIDVATQFLKLLNSMTGSVGTLYGTVSKLILTIAAFKGISKLLTGLFSGLSTIFTVAGREGSETFWDAFIDGLTKNAKKKTAAKAVSGATEGAVEGVAKKATKSLSGVGAEAGGAIPKVSQLWGILKVNPFFWVAVATAAISVLYGVFKHFYEGATERLERLKKTAAAAKAEADEIISSNEELTNSLERLDDGLETFENLTYGTSEWKDQLQLVNDSILDIIANYPSLAKYLTVGKDGVFELDAEGLKQFQADRKNEEQGAIAKSIAADAFVEREGAQQSFDKFASKEVELYVENLISDKVSSLTASYGEGESITGRIAGAGEKVDFLNALRESGLNLFDENDKNEIFSLMETHLNSLSDTPFSSDGLEKMYDYMQTEYGESIHNHIKSANITLDNFVKINESLIAQWISNIEGIADLDYQDIITPMLKDRAPDYLSNIEAEKERLTKQKGTLSDEQIQDYVDLSDDPELTIFKVEELLASEEEGVEDGVYLDYARLKEDAKLATSFDELNIGLELLSNELSKADFNLLAKSLKDETLSKNEVNSLGDVAKEVKASMPSEEEYSRALQMRAAGVDPEQGFLDTISLYETSKELLDSLQESEEQNLRAIEEATERFVKDQSLSKDLRDQAQEILLDKLDPEISEAYSNKLSVLAHTQGEKAAFDLLDAFGKATLGLSDEQVQLLAENLGSLDWTNLDELENLEDVLLGLGFGAEESKSIADLLVKSIAKANKAIRKFDLETVAAEIEEGNKILQKVKSGTDTFSQEEFDFLDSISQNLPEEIQVELSRFNKELDGSYTYLGSNMQDLALAIEANTLAREEALGARVQAGELVQTDAVTSWNQKTIEQVDQDDETEMHSYLNNFIETALLEGLDIDLLGVEGLTSEGTKGLELAELQSIFSELLNFLNNQEINQQQLQNLHTQGVQQQAQLKTPAELSMLATEARDSGQVEEAEAYTNALMSQAKAAEISAATIAKYDTALKSNNKSQIEAAEGAVEHEIALKKIQKEIGPLSDSMFTQVEALKEMEEGSAEFNLVLAEMAEGFNEALDKNLSDDFFETAENLQLLEDALLGSQPAWEQLLINMDQAAISSDHFAQQFNLNANTIMELVGLMDGLSFDINGRAEVTDIFNKLTEVMGSTEAAAAYLEALGYSNIEFDMAMQDKQVITEIIHRPGQQPEIIYGTIQVPKKIYATKVDIPAARSASSFGAGAPSARSAPKKGGGGGKGGGGKEEEPWENSIDWLYNLQKDINDEIRERNKLEREYNRILEDGQATAQEKHEATQDLIDSLAAERAMQEAMQRSRGEELDRLFAANTNLSQYVQYDSDTKDFQIDWNKIEQITDRSVGDSLTNLISEAEATRDSMNSAADSLDNIDDQIKDLINRGRDQYKEMIDKTYDGLVAAYERGIDELKRVNDTINNTNEKLINSIQGSLDKQRRDRQNERTEDALSEKQRRLAYLRQDTSGANQTEILALEEELSLEQESYTDQLIDEKISALQQQNEEAAAQRDLQIEIAQAQLDRAIEIGELWEVVDALIFGGMINTDQMVLSNLDAAGNIVYSVTKMEDNMKVTYDENGNKITEQLLENGNVIITRVLGNGQISLVELNSKGETIRSEVFDAGETIWKETDKWGREVQTSVDDEGRWIREIIGSDGTKLYSAIVNNEGVKGWINAGVTATGKLIQKSDLASILKAAENYKGMSTIAKMNWMNTTNNRLSDIHSWLKGFKIPKTTINIPAPIVNVKTESGATVSTSNTNTSITNNVTKIPAPTPVPTPQPPKVATNQHSYVNYSNNTKSQATVEKRSGYDRVYSMYKKGGLVDYTGPAWLDGTPSSPEMVLNPQDTKNFIQLKDILAGLMSGPIRAGSEASQVGNVYYDINIEVDSITDDYSVDQMVDRIKQKINEDMRYRSVNAVSFQKR